jgi:hypothetical protein
MHLNSNEIHGWNEDAQLSAILKPLLQSYGYKYCPDSIAKHFSMEYVGLGFHEEDFDFGTSGNTYTPQIEKKETSSKSGLDFF